MDNGGISPKMRKTKPIVKLYPIELPYTRRVVKIAPVSKTGRDLYSFDGKSFHDVLICRIMPAEDTSLFPVSEICLKPLTIVLLLILSKTFVFISFCVLCSF